MAFAEANSERFISLPLGWCGQAENLSAPEGIQWKDGVFFSLSALLEY